MPERTYVGGQPHGTVEFHDDDHHVVASVPFRRGVPTEFTADQAKRLGDDWKTPKSKAAQAAPTPEEPSDG